MRSHLVLSMLFASWLVAPAAGAALISEFLYDAPGSDNGFGFVEIAGEAGLELEGWAVLVINGSNGEVATTITLGGTIPDDRIYVVADRGTGGETSVPGADRVENFDIQNGPDSLHLIDAGGALRDAVGFGEFGPDDFFAGEGTPAPDVDAGSSLERLFADLDTGDNAADFAAQPIPNPGVALFQGSAPPAPSPSPGDPIPEPSTALLCAIGLLWLGRSRGAQ